MAEKYAFVFVIFFREKMVFDLPHGISEDISVSSESVLSRYLSVLDTFTVSRFVSYSYFCIAIMRIVS